MRIATFLPHVGVFGGVRRFLELGSAWRRAGHEVVLYHPDGTRPLWLEYDGPIARLDDAAHDASDLAWCADPHTFDAFRSHRSTRHVYYCVLEKDPGVERAIREPSMTLAANSSPLLRALRRRRQRVLDGIGGIDPAHFSPAAGARRPGPMRILVNGRRSRPKKGTDLILRALSGLRDLDLEVTLFDSPGAGDTDPRQSAPAFPAARWVLGPTQETLAGLYRDADLFVAAERKAGWCNTALEAMSCGCAVACTRSGTTDFARHGETAWVIAHRHPFFIRRAVRRMLADEALRARLAAAGPAEAARWSWPRLAARLLEQAAA